MQAYFFVSDALHPVGRLFEAESGRKAQLRKVAELFFLPAGQIQTVDQRLFGFRYQKAPLSLVPVEPVKYPGGDLMDLKNTRLRANGARVRGGRQSDRLGNLFQNPVQMKRADEGNINAPVREQTRDDFERGYSPAPRLRPYSAVDLDQQSLIYKTIQALNDR